MAIKDQYDTFDMRSTSGADAFYANDRPPTDATVVKRLRAAGAIILAKANLDEYAGGAARSSFGGTECNPYDTERDPGGSSGGSATAVAANFVTCAIGEETGGSIIKPSQFNNIVGLVPTRELVSAEGMIQQGLNTRVGPMCRTVQDAARILNAYAGYDPADELTAFSRQRKPPRAYPYSAGKKTLKGFRIGVVREYMDKDLFTEADAESIDLVDRAIVRLRKLGATVVDPGPHGALFQSCVDRYAPKWLNQQYVAQFPNAFPVDATGAPAADHVGTLVRMFMDPSSVVHTTTGRPSIRNLGGVSTDVGDAKYNFNVYLAKRGDANIRTLTDLVQKANFYDDPRLGSRKGSLERSDAATTLKTASALQSRFTMQTVVQQCFAEKDLDAVVYPAGNIPPGIITAPEEPSKNDRGTSWNQISSRGFPSMTVPAGFTTNVYDRDESGALLPAKPAVLPVGVEFLALPFEESTLFNIGSAYEHATHHRRQPPEFGPLAG